MRPRANATVETISKYTSALTPTRPTSFKLPIAAMPSTTLRKMIGASVMLIRRMNPSPSGFSVARVREQRADCCAHDDATTTCNHSGPKNE